MSKQQLETAHKEINKFSNYTSASQILDSEIPATFDLRNIKGVNYAGRVRDQGGCGSCYIHAFIQTIENRLRMKHGVSAVPDLSIQQLVSCNYLTEGCDGGWGTLNGFFAENTGLIKESCAPYVGHNTKCGYTQCAEAARVTRTYFVSPSETGIQKEILKNGMVDVSWAFPTSASFFGKGVLSNVQIESGDSIDDLTHATTIIGWGVESDKTGDKKYWIVRNSYGPSFGEGGDFKVIRGVNAYQIEGYAGAYEVELL